MISIIIPVYNEEKYVDECINSIINQYKHNNFEIIVIDDASTDNTYYSINKYKKFDFIKVFQNNKNMGLSYSRNLGINLSKGDYIMFVDGDDMLMENAIENIEYYINKSNPDVIIGMLKGIAENGFDRVYSDPTGSYEIDSFNLGHILIDMQERGYKIAPSVKYILSKKIVTSKKLFFECIHHEDQLWSPTILINCNTFEILDNYFYYYRLHKDGLSQNISFSVTKDYVYIIRGLIKQHSKLDDHNKELFLLMRIGYLFNKLYIMMQNLSNDERIMVKEILNKYRFNLDLFKGYINLEAYNFFKR